MDKFESLRNLLIANRSVRRFDNSRRISCSTVEELVELTRYCASGRNLQPLRYRIVTDSAECEALFPLLAWAGYYTDWDGPAEMERPVAYLVQCLDTELTKNCLCDDGLQLEAITLGATARGIAGCIIKSFNKAGLQSALNLAERYEPRYVLALGYPAEKVKIVELGTDGDYKYYRDKDSTQCVPKRQLSDLII
ncbi:MAG: nitroreductase family protein [Lachnoclostridium sp.]|nr:nitroreductase family protein [Lachnoclostridium sp.]